MSAFGLESISLVPRHSKSGGESEDMVGRLEWPGGFIQESSAELETHRQRQPAVFQGCLKNTSFAYKIKMLIFLFVIGSVITLVVHLLRSFSASPTSSIEVWSTNSSTISNLSISVQNNSSLTTSQTSNVSQQTSNQSSYCDLLQSDVKINQQVNLDPGILSEPNEQEYHNVLEFLRKHLKQLYARQTYANLSSMDLSTLEQLAWDRQLKIDSLWEMNLLIPNKFDRNRYFQSLRCDSNLTLSHPVKLERYAQVVILHGSEPTPVIREYRVGPMNEPREMHELRTIDYYKRPLNSIEYGALLDFLTIQTVQLDELLQKAYEASFFMTRPSKRWIYPIPNLNESYFQWSDLVSRCQNKTDMSVDNHGRPECLVPMFASAMVTQAAPGRRRSWFRLTREVAPIIQYPVDIQFHIDHTSLNPAEWTLEQIWFQGQLFGSTRELVNQYDSGQLKINALHFQDMYSEQLRPGPNQIPYVLRSTRTANRRLGQPTSCYFETNRIFVDKHHVRYMNWDFHLTLRRDTGLRLFGIYYDDISLVAEVGLDETVTSYWGRSPFIRAMTSLESMFGVGGMTGELSPGLDCPINAIYLPVNLVPSGESGPQTIKRGVCLFESTAQMMGGPIRRHFEFQPYNAGTSGGSDSVKHTNFAFGAPNRVLVVRSISSLFNYDYLFDVIFHVSGVIEVSVTPTGYVHVDNTVDYSSDQHLPNPWDHPDAYGFASPLFPINFIIHHHLFHFKVDVDIGKPENFFQTIDIMGPLTNQETENQDLYPGYFGANLTPALWMSSRILQNEMDGKIAMHFEKPKQYLICQSRANQKTKLKSNKRELLGRTKSNDKCLSLTNRSPIKTIFDDNHTKSFAWSRHQLHVTRQHDSEPFASSIYNGVDIGSPVVDFTKFSLDNESIVDQDLVLWVTIGNYHLPRQEDLPSTPTSAGRLSFHLMPHNLFHYSPDAYSCDRFYTRHLNEWLDGPEFLPKCKYEPIPHT